MLLILSICFLQLFFYFLPPLELELLDLEEPELLPDERLTDPELRDTLLELRDIPELPDRIREDLTLVPVSHLDEVLELALIETGEPPFSLGSSDKGGKIAIPPVSGTTIDRPIQTAN